jgi:hypothetical protein
LKWSEWYAVKWWEEVYSELGLQSIRESVFARALFISLKIRGYLREDGRIKKRPEKPEYPHQQLRHRIRGAPQVL